MFILFESAGGLALFKVTDESKMESVDNIFDAFKDKDNIGQFVQLENFQQYENLTDAAEAAKCLQSGERLHSSLSNFLQTNIIDKIDSDSITLGVCDTKYGSLIKDHFKNNLLNIESNDKIFEFTRCLRENFLTLLASLTPAESTAMQLGLSHALARHKLKFSAEKVDTMIIQAISLLDELDKEINIYAMRVKEWYGWHFPEMQKIILENISYCKCVKLMGMRDNSLNIDFSTILDEATEIRLKNMSKISMGSQITKSDLENILELSDQVIELTDYREQLYEYLSNRMKAIAPNLTLMVGELVGARLLSHAGSLINLAKYPASTVQILGAEKALFRALKTGSDTPKYGLIYHASFVTAASNLKNNKAKLARSLACKAALSVRIDAFTEQERSGKENVKTTSELNRMDDDNDDDEEDDDIRHLLQADDNSESIVNLDYSAKMYTNMEKRLNFVEGRKVQVKSKLSGAGVGAIAKSKHEFGQSSSAKDEKSSYDESQDVKLTKKRKLDDDDDDDNDEPPKKKQRLSSGAEATQEEDTDEPVISSTIGKSDKREVDDDDEDGNGENENPDDDDDSDKKKKKKKKKDKSKKKKDKKKKKKDKKEKSKE